MSDPRNHGDGTGPERVPSYGHKFGALHDRVVGDERPDDTFYSKISNKRKVDYICNALGMAPHAFHLDLPFPLEDWADSGDMSLINSGLYFADLRRQFFEALILEDRSRENSPAFKHHAESEFWNYQFNRIIAKRQRGEIIGDHRVLN